MLHATNSLTNLSNESHYALQRCNSAEEVFETNSINRMHVKAKQKARDRQFLADSTSDYYTSRRPQSMFLNSQAPVYSSLQPASSVSALGTISENEMWDHTLTRPHAHNWAPEEIPSYPERSNTPLFRYTPTPVMEMAAPLSRPTTPQVLGQQRAMTPQILGEGIFLDDCDGRATPTAVSIHSSEQVTREFVPLFLNPQNGQVYSRDDGFFVPISNQDELLAKPPKPVRTSYDNFKFILYIYCPFMEKVMDKIIIKTTHNNCLKFQHFILHSEC